MYAATYNMNLRSWNGHMHLFMKPCLFLPNFISSTTDPFLNDGCDLPYNTTAHFSQPEHTFLNHPQASEVSVNMLVCIQLVLTRSSVTFSPFRLCVICYHIRFSWGSNAIWECGLCVHQCIPFTSKMRVAGTKVHHIIIFSIYAHIYIYIFLQVSCYTAPGRNQQACITSTSSHVEDVGSCPQQRKTWCSYYSRCTKTP